MRTTHIPARAHRRLFVATLTLLAVSSPGACATESPTAASLEAGAPFATAWRSIAAGSDVPGCHPDSKLIGRIELSTADVPGTWWSITRQGFDAAGITDYLALIEAAFGQPFGTLDQAVAFLVDAVRPLDENGNGYVCAYQVRGTRANYGLPLVSNYIFATTDDDHRAR